MPTVPTADNFRVLPSTGPTGGFSQFADANGASLVGRQLEEAGDKILNAGNKFANIEIDALDQANQLRVDDALNQVKEAQLKLTYDPKDGYQNVKGINALQRESGMSLADDYGNILQEKISSIAATLGNDAQKQAFMAHADSLLVNFKGDATQHEGAEFQTYAVSVRDGTIKNRQNEIALNYSNPQVVEEAVTSIKAATYDQARLLGKSAEWAEAAAREATSKAHALAINTALQKNNPTFADAYMKKFAKDMEADDILSVNGSLTKQLDGQLGLNIATSVIQDMGPKIQTSDSDRAFNIALGTESNHRQFASDGVTPLTSSAGAIGIAQVMPDTAKEVAAANGIEWDETKYKTDAAYNSKLGKLYFDKQLKDFDGNLAMAYAAYNAGPGKQTETGYDAEGKPLPGVRPAMARAKGKGTPENWVAELPAETQNYVAKNMISFGNGGGQYTKPTLVEVQNEVRKRIGANQPERLKIALDEAERQYSEIGKAEQQKNDDAVANAMRGVMDNGGRFTDLPANVRGAITKPEDTLKVMEFAKKIAAGDDTTSLYLYQKLSSDPTALKNMTDSQFFALRSELSQADFKHFADQRGKLITGTGENGPGDLNNDAIKRTLDDRLITMGFNPNPTDKESDEAAQMGAVRQFVNQQIAVEQANRGKKLTDVEVTSFIDQLFAQQASVKYIGFGWTGPTLKEKNVPLITSTVSDIPGPTKDALKAAFKRQGVTDPSDADLLNAYLNQVAMANRVKAKSNGG